MSYEPYVVLMVADNKHDIVAAIRVWKQLHIKNPLYVVNGEECLDFRLQRRKYSEPGAAPRASILLVDVNMPKMNGLTVLKHIRADDKLRRLPVVILTTSDLEEDRVKSYDLGANAFIRKPDGFDNFSNAIKATNVLGANRTSRVTP
jgi:CheY-like chemotaxis protein